MAEQPKQLIVVGASAGGIEALSALVSTLPAGLAAPLVIAQHLDPRRTSHLEEILSARSTLPVEVVGDHQPLRNGVVYVIPPGVQAELTDHEISATPDVSARPMPSIDLLFSTAASVFEENLIAVILSGSGNDGAAGARDVKASGGTVIIQNPETAAHPHMPLSLAPTTVDIIANLESIGALLGELVAGGYQRRAPTDERQLQLLLEQLRERSGIDFSSYKTPTIMRRLQRRMVATATGRLTDYIRFMQRNPDEYQRLINSFLIKVTEFFRDPELFEYLRDHVLPPLVEQARERGELRVWSAGCATGEEPYSLAILLLELLGEDIDSINLRIFATDLDADAVAFARRGIYPASTLVDVPEQLIARYFTQIDGAWEVRKLVRSLVVFGQHDLGQRAPFPRIDLTLCRNVLIYFTTDLQKRALQLFAFALRDGGFLVLGKAETVSPLPELFALEQPRLKVYRRVGERVLIPSARIRDTAPLMPVRVTPPRPGVVNTDPVSARLRREPQPPTVSDRADTVLMRLPIGIVVVDREYDILTINTTARRMLGIHTAAIGEDLIHRIQNIPLLDVRNAIDAAFRGEPATLNVQIPASGRPDSQPVDLEIRCAPESLDSPAGIADAVTIVITDVSRFLAGARAREDDLQQLRADSRRALEQAQRLAETNETLLQANDELTAAITVLRAENEELLVANEEVQSATEEVETLNEELQATNEELETLNEELQATIEELNTTNDDLQARSLELQDLAISHEEQRRVAESARERLAAILSHMRDAVLVVDAAGGPLLTNAAFEEAFGERGERLQPEEDAGVPLPADEHPLARLRQGEAFTLQFSIPQPDGSRRWYEASGQPIAEGSDTGEQRGVVVIRDITERSLRRLQDEFLALASHELRTPLTALNGNLQLLRRALTSGRDEQGLRQLLDVADDQLRQLRMLVSDLLDVVRLQTGRLELRREPVALAEIVDRSAEAARAIHAEPPIAVELPAAPVIVEVDSRRFEQVLMNLLTNAATHATGATRIALRLRTADGQAEIEVSDDGAGIPAADLERVFSRFARLDAARDGLASDGLGLGLFIAREIVVAHGGTLDARSAPGSGATFTIRLPLAAGGSPPPPLSS